MTELDSKLHQRISRFCDIGDELAARGAFLQAIDAYRHARSLLPEPLSQWQAATWIAAAIGDTHFLAGHYKAAHDELHAALAGNFPGAQGNAFIHMRLGQAAFELGQHAQAAAELHRAHVADSAVFAGENSKYLAFLTAGAPLPDTSSPLP